MIHLKYIQPACVDRKYNLGVIVDLHAAPGSQNPWEHSSSRDGTQDWGTSDANIAQTVQVIEFLASRSARSINESNSHGIDLHSNLGLHLDDRLMVLQVRQEP
jgi:aryl-phospho-beta-D-glucosidase BglC (GH1 family)